MLVILLMLLVKLDIWYLIFQVQRSSLLTEFKTSRIQSPPEIETDESSKEDEKGEKSEKMDNKESIGECGKDVLHSSIYIHFRLMCCLCPILWGWQHQAMSNTGSPCIPVEWVNTS